MRFEEALLSLTRNGQARLTEQQKKPERDTRAREGKTGERKRERGLSGSLSLVSHTQAIWRPREVAKASDIPKSMIETFGAAFGRALRARRSAQERRQCARSARESSRTGGG